MSVASDLIGLPASASYETGIATHVGLVRTHNEDNYIAEPDSGLWAVADGMGGHEAGDVASATVIEALERARGLVLGCNAEKGGASFPVQSNLFRLVDIRATVSCSRFSVAWELFAA